MQLVVMLSHAWHGGPLVEVLSAQGKQPEGAFKKTGAVRKVFDKSVKGYVLELEGGRDAKVQLPAADKETLGLLQPYLVLQVLVPPGKGFAIELAILDKSKTRRRLHLSCNCQDIQATPLHVRAPLHLVRRGVWLNLCIDVAGIFQEAFTPVTRIADFWSIESMVLTAACKVRRIFTVRQPLRDTSPDGDDFPELEVESWLHDVEELPRSVDYPAGIENWTQVLHMAKIRHVLMLDAQLKVAGDSAVRAASPRRVGAGAGAGSAAQVLNDGELSRKSGLRIAECR